MKYLLDTCVVSELRRERPDAQFIRCFQLLDSDQLFLSVISIGEITKGIGLLEAGKRKTELLEWLGQLTKHYTSRILPINAETAFIWGEMTANARKNGKTVPACDGLIAATALQHGLHVMTRNSADFAPTGALLFNPFEEVAAARPTPQPSLRGF